MSLHHLSPLKEVFASSCYTGEDAGQEAQRQAPLASHRAGIQTKPSLILEAKLTGRMSSQATQPCSPHLPS